MTGVAETDRRPEPPAPAPWVYDVLLALGVTLVVSLVIAADVDGAGAAAAAYAWPVLLGALLLLRRRFPAVVAALSGVAVIGYHAAGHPAIGVAVPAAAAVFSAAEHGRTVVAALVSSALVAVSTGYRLAAGQDPAYVVGYELPSHAIILAGAIALGDGVRSRRALRRQADEIAGLVAERYQREAEQQVVTERLAVARDLHDSVGHALTVINLHAEVAEEAAAAGDDEAARQALAVVSETTATTFDHLRRTVTSLRREGPPERSPLRIADLGSATRPAEQAGIDVRTVVDVRSPLSPTVEAAVYRIVQESITNVVRHASASQVLVRVEESGSAVRVVVENDTAGDLPPASPDRPERADRADRADPVGHGIRGMRERTHLLGGRFSAGPVPSGFCVRATIPLTPLEVTT